MTDIDIRPDLPLEEVDALIERSHKEKWLFQGTPNDYRVFHHLERYWFVRDYLIRKYGSSFAAPGVLSYFHPSLIDCGCGRALGLRELLKSHLHIASWNAIESDPEVCENLAEKIKYSCLSVCNQNIEDYQIETPPDCYRQLRNYGLFDFVICFEVLGFTTLSSDENLIKKLNSLCKPGGYIFISTPNYRDREKKKYFGRVYDRHSFTALVRQEMPNHDVELYGQLYPTNRKGMMDLGVQAPEYLSADPDFLVLVAQKPKTEEVAKRR